MCQYIFIKKDNFIMLKQLDGSTLLDFKNFTNVPVYFYKKG